MSNRSMSPLKQAYMYGMQNAAREHGSLGTNLKNRIDIYDIVRQKDVYLMFQPLRPLYGAFLYEERSPGILINSNHPPNLRRFTAAHEYGHCIMKHGTRTDNEESILHSKQRNKQEVEAQSFAAHFLMPLQLVNIVLHQMELPLMPDSLTAQDVYQLALRLGASYTAVINHLVSLKKISQSVAYNLAHKKPKEIKTEIGSGIRPLDNAADAWIFSERDTGRNVTAHVNDELHIYLPEETTGNEIWRLHETAEQLSIILIKSDLEISSQPTRDEKGNPYSRHFVFRVQTPGNRILRLARQDVENAQTPSRFFELQLNTLPRLQLGLYEPQQVWLQHPAESET